MGRRKRLGIETVLTWCTIVALIPVGMIAWQTYFPTFYPSFFHGFR